MLKENQSETVEANQNRPSEGQSIKVRGRTLVITKVLPLGTIDAEDIYTGKAYRVSGLNFI